AMLAAAIAAAMPLGDAAAAGPPKRSVEEDPPRVGVERYASICVELTSTPRDTVLARYQLDETQLAAVDAHYVLLFQRDPATYGAFRAAYDAYEEWLRASAS
ncbi:MAG: hypothetical protein AAGA56_29085, partial [Myxococcota bacterium]